MKQKFSFFATSAWKYLNENARPFFLGAATTYFLTQKHSTSAISAFFNPSSKEEIKAILEKNRKNAEKTEAILARNKALIEETKKIVAQTKPAKYN